MLQMLRKIFVTKKRAGTDQSHQHNEECEGEGWEGEETGKKGKMEGVCKKKGMEREGGMAHDLTS